jgi:hypothetical protein
VTVRDIEGLDELEQRAPRFWNSVWTAELQRILA